jgi:hypothetical protein
VVNVEDGHNTATLVNSVDDAVGSAPGAVTSREWPEQRLPDTLGIDRKRGIANLQHRGGNGFRQPLGNRSLTAFWDHLHLVNKWLRCL